MQHSGFDFINLKDTAKTTGYKTFELDKHVLAVKWDSTLSRAAGAMYSTTGDLYKWARAIAQKGIITPASWQQAFTPHLGAYGDGWFIDTLYDNKYVYHSGGLLGYMSSFRYYPDKDVTVILLNNFGYYDQTLLTINNALSEIVFNKYDWKKREAITLDEALLQQYIGAYTINKKDKLLITAKGHQLYAQSTSKNGIPKLPVYAENENTFYLKDFDAVLTFVRGADNNVVKIISHENGKVIEYNKIK